MKSIVSFILSFMICTAFLSACMTPDPDKNNKAEYKHREATLLDKPYSGYIPNYAPKHPAIVHLHMRTENGLNFFCTGFIVSDYYAVTADHCITDKKGIVSNEIAIYDSSDVDTGVIAHAAGANHRMDYGLLRGDFSQFDRLPVLTDTLDLGSEYYVSCGFPFGQRDMFCTPVVIRTNQYFFFAATGFIYPGMSGGPVIDPRDGKVIALNSRVGPGIIMLSPLIGLFDSLGVVQE